MGRKIQAGRARTAAITSVSCPRLLGRCNKRKWNKYSNRFYSKRAWNERLTYVNVQTMLSSDNSAVTKSMKCLTFEETYLRLG